MLKAVLARGIGRLILGYLGLFLVSVVLVFALVYWVTIGFVESRTNETLASELAVLEADYRSRGMPGLIRAVAERAAEPGTPMVYLVATVHGHIVAGNLPAWPRDVSPDGTIATIALPRHPDDASGPVSARAAGFDLPGGLLLLVGRSTADEEMFRDRVIYALAGALVFIVGIGALGGWLIARDLSNRVEAMNATARQIIQGNLRQRIAHAQSGDALDGLAANLNAMLDQIERLMAGMRQATDGIAHDLRTPLTRIRSRLELALIGTRDAETYRRVLDETIRDIDRLLTVFQSLLNIAQAEAGTSSEPFEPVDLNEIARRVAELYEPVADDKAVTLTVEADETTPAIAHGSEQLLAQAVANLVDNAVKYTPTRGRVAVIVSPAANGAGPAITIRDTGPGIPPIWRERVRERFVRLDRAGSHPGSGLGLSLAHAAARLHGARLVLDDAEPECTDPARRGLAARLAFPPPG